MSASTAGRIAVVATGLFGGAVASAGVLWDTGAPHLTNFNGADSYLGFNSGNIGGGFEQRWAAMPFKVASNGTVINAVDVDWFVQPGQEAKDVNYIIWKRSGLNAPVDGDQYSTGKLGDFGVGIDDPRIPATENYLHQYTGLNIPIDAGDYYFTMYGDGIGAGNNTGFANTPWLTGGDLQDEALEQDFMWRSAQFPSPGFAQYAPGNVLPGANMADGQDRWNCSFVLYGDVVPAPSAAALLGLAGLAGARRRR